VINADHCVSCARCVLGHDRRRPAIPQRRVGRRAFPRDRASVSGREGLRLFEDIDMRKAGIEVVEAISSP
jgi:hypothetical protein